MGVGLDPHDLLSGETLPVPEVTGAARLREHDVLFAWVMELPDHRALTGAVELLYRRVPGLRTAIEHAARAMRQGGWTESTLLDPPQLLDRSSIGDFLQQHAIALMAAGWSRQPAIAGANLLSIHAFNILTYELHRKKTFWVDESLAFMLGCTRLDVRGEALGLPFPCFALVFTDRETLGLGGWPAAAGEA